jgi:hypothetical protein
MAVRDNLLEMMSCAQSRTLGLGSGVLVEFVFSSQHFGPPRQATKLYRSSNMIETTSTVGYFNFEAPTGGWG